MSALIFRVKLSYKKPAKAGLFHRTYKVKHFMPQGAALEAIEKADKEGAYDIKMVSCTREAKRGTERKPALTKSIARGLSKINSPVLSYLEGSCELEEISGFYGSEQELQDCRNAYDYMRKLSKWKLS